jgi:Sec23/Sec24 trunk domain
MCTIGLGYNTCRDDPKLYNTDKERQILSPASDLYVKLAEDCVSHRICVDLFFTLNSANSIDQLTQAETYTSRTLSTPLNTESVYTMRSSECSLAIKDQKWLSKPGQVLVIQ